MNRKAANAGETKKRILVAVDDSAEARRALRYVAAIVGGRAEFRVDLYHRLPALPPDLREPGAAGRHRPESESRRELAARIAAWISALREELQTTLASLKKDLVAAGVRAEAVDFCVEEDVTPGETLSDALRRAARQRGCGTIAVSRRHLAVAAGLGAFLSRPASEQPVRREAALAIWLIE